MESADLRIFQIVAREGSVSRAAQQLGYVQSNVTARVRHLESELGTELFQRHNRGMTLSASGKLLLNYADKIVGLLDEAGKALSSKTEPAGPLMIGSTQTAAAVRLPKLLTAYYGHYPNVLLSLSTAPTAQLIEKVLRFELDGAFIGCECTHPELLAMPAFEEELVIASAASVLSLEEAMTKPIVTLGAGCTYRELLEQWLRANDLTQSVIMEFGTLEAIIGGVSAGLGISLLPQAVIAKQEAEGSLRAHPFPEPLRRMKTEFVIRKDSFVSSALRAFIEMLPEPGAS
ncbi:LysR family transcriptional regulator [Paenibacillus doosanensis]|uniref:LysR family transcriptional regulator n=1 Tax=Paenibacillus doosanensis TaxID=1229154 RepID=UPI00217FD947|nr:LysR family transcriptional regulator [Paenibacillus doosanensis]MCS7461949.1 LysR family transcriptional regulator [Paenibacillus doosanensis]